MLTKYFKLLDQYDSFIWTPSIGLSLDELLARHKKREEMVREMDKLLPNPTKKEEDEIKSYLLRLYNKRVGA